MKADRSERPNCDEIVETKKDWRLNESDLLIDYQSIINRLSIDSIVELLSQKSIESESLENSFIKRLIKLKFHKTQVP
jgi:hypothetical protein